MSTTESPIRSPGESPVRVEHADGYQVVSLLSQLHDTPWSEIEAAGEDVLRQFADVPTPRVVMDLSALSHMGSALVALIVRIWKSVKDRDGGMVVVVSDDGVVLQVLTIAGLDRVWTIVPSREQALDKIGVSRQAVGQRREARLLAMTGPAMALAGAVALAIAIGGSANLSPRAALILALLCAVQGLAFGGLLALRAVGGGRRALGAAAALVSIAVIVTGLLRLPEAWKLSPPAEEPQVLSQTQEPSP